MIAACSALTMTLPTPGDVAPPQAGLDCRQSPIRALGTLAQGHQTHRRGGSTQTATFQQIGEGLPVMVSSLKSLLETGTPLPVG